MMDIADFCRLFDEPAITTPRTLHEIRTLDTGYTPLSGLGRDALILSVMKTIDSNTLSKTGVVDKWERHWSDVRDEFKKTGDTSILTPAFIQHGRTCRMYRDYVDSSSDYFENHISTIIRCWLYETYMQGTSDVFEFGCGSGWNIRLMAEVYPGRKIWGLDWSRAAVDIVNILREKSGLNVEGCWFDMFNPHESLMIPKGSQVLTIGALEQMGDKFRPFVDFLIRKGVGRVCCLEPVLEFYDDNTLLDYLSIRFHTQRNYLNGYYTYLRELENRGVIRIVKATRIEFGSLFQDGWSILIWETV